MHPDSRSPAGDAQETPSTDLQPQDTGTAASGTPTRGTAAQAAMKQTSKTAHETGSTGENGSSRESGTGRERQ